MSRPSTEERKHKVMRHRFRRLKQDLRSVSLRYDCAPAIDDAYTNHPAPLRPASLRPLRYARGSPTCRVSASLRLRSRGLRPAFGGISASLRLRSDCTGQAATKGHQDKTLFDRRSARRRRDGVGRSCNDTEMRFVGSANPAHDGIPHLHRDVGSPRSRQRVPYTSFRGCYAKTSHSVRRMSAAGRPTLDSDGGVVAGRRGRCDAMAVGTEG
jgi:hypothetical protein